MKLSESLKRARSSQWRSLEKEIRKAWERGFREGEKRAHGAGRRGRTIRGDATVAGLVTLIEKHFGLDRYRFEIRIVHAGSRRGVPSEDLIRRYRRED